MSSHRSSPNAFPRPTRVDVHVPGGTLSPRQQRTKLSMMRSCDFFAQRMLKIPERCYFHCLAEFYHAALLEGNPAVTYFCPQPYPMRVNGRPYVPDMYAVIDGVRYVQELRPEGEFPDAMRLPLEAYFRSRHMVFEVVSNEAVLAREIEAQNWLDIIRSLLGAQDIDTDRVESELIEAFLEGDAVRLDVLIDAGHRDATELKEIAVYRLLYRGVITTDLAHDFLCYDSELRLCT